MARVTVCICPCHNVHRGTQRAAQQMGKYMKGFTHADRANHWDALGCARGEDAVEAALASGCPCIDEHCAALLTPAPSRGPMIVRRFDPTSESQADGDTGEGAE